MRGESSKGIVRIVARFDPTELKREVNLLGGNAREGGERKSTKSKSRFARRPCVVPLKSVVHVCKAIIDFSHDPRLIGLMRER